MRQLLYLSLFLFLPTLLLAQDNYVANVANSATPGTFNTLVGSRAGNGAMTGHYNSFMGSYTGFYNTTGRDNTFVGFEAGYNNRTGDYNTFVGSIAGFYNTTGRYNTTLGYYAGAYSTTGYSNVLIGIWAGYRTGPAFNVVAVGDSAGYNNRTGENVFVGSKAGFANTTGIQNTFIGYRTGFANTGLANTFVGYRAGQANTTGQFNTFMGVGAGLNSTTGSSNLFLGTNAGRSNTSGSANFFVGDNAGYYNTTGGYNVYLGVNAGNSTGVNGSNNIAIGFEAGRNNGGSNNLFLGFRADAGYSNLTNATSVGPNARVDVSNAVVLGSTDVNVGIGTSAPVNKLHIVGGIPGSAGIRLGITSATAPIGNASKFLTVNSNGDMILANYANGAKEEAIDALWQRNGSFLQSTKGEAVIVGSGVSKTPSGYSIFVGQGLLAEKVKVAVRNTSEWSDHVFKSAYRLRPLSVVEQYVNTNGHLPGIPSAQEMVEQGNDLHRTDAKLLEKIEELTLYSIQLEKTNQQQQAEIDKQRLEIDTLKKQQAEIDELKRLVNQFVKHK